MKKLNWKKSVSVLLIGSQFGVAMSAFAAPTTATSVQVTPELTLVEGVVVLEGQKLSQDAETSQLRALVSQYSATTQADGQSERMQQALVTLGIYTPDQASKFVSDAQASTTKVVASAHTSPTQLNQTVSAEMVRLASLHPAGAEFSACSVTDAIDPAPVALLGLLVGLIGVGVYSSDVNTPNMEQKSIVEDEYIMYGGLGLFVAAAIMAAVTQNCDN